MAIQSKIARKLTTEKNNNIYVQYTFGRYPTGHPIKLNSRSGNMHLNRWIVRVLILTISIRQSNSMIKQTSTVLVFKPQWQNQGVGARVIRIVGNSKLPDLSPFLMMDFAKVRLPAGFPDHPHRGFETVAYLLKGSFYHEDSKGHRGKLSQGDVQWMTAGKGIVHSEMPASFEQDSVGFQLWINLQAKNKLIEPQYQEYKSQKIPLVEHHAARVKVISGEWEGVKGPIVARTPVYYFDVELVQNGHFELNIPATWNAFIFVFEGNLLYNGSTSVQLEHVCVLTHQAQAHKFEGDAARFVLVAGQPINEPVAKYGPIVMNTQAEIQTAFQDYQNGSNGFEGVHEWTSKIQLLSQGKTPNELGM